jgi:hypothetical protein
MYNSLHLPFAFDKRLPRFAVDECVNFFCCGGKAFLWGVLRKCAFSAWCFGGEVVVI